MNPKHCDVTYEEFMAHIHSKGAVHSDTNIEEDYVDEDYTTADNVLVGFMRTYSWPAITHYIIVK